MNNKRDVEIKEQPEKKESSELTEKPIHDSANVFVGILDLIKSIFR